MQLPAPGYLTNIRQPDEVRPLLMRSCYESGMSLAETGRIFGITRERVRQVLEKAGVKRRAPGSGKRKHKARMREPKHWVKFRNEARVTLYKERILRLCWLSANGFPMSQSYKAVGFTDQSTLGTWARFYGIPIWSHMAKARSVTRPPSGLYRGNLKRACKELLEECGPEIEAMSRLRPVALALHPGIRRVA